MKRTFQKFDITAVANDTTTLSEQLRQDYNSCTGIFIIPKKEVSLNDITVQLKIAGYEVLPSGFDASLIAFTGAYPLKDAMYDFSRENVPARSSEMELQVTNIGTDAIPFTVYFVLENK